jgi:hypothetical protein
MVSFGPRLPYGGCHIYHYLSPGKYCVFTVYMITPSNHSSVTTNAHYFNPKPLLSSSPLSSFTINRNSRLDTFVLFVCSGLNWQGGLLATVYCLLTVGMDVLRRVARDCSLEVMCARAR